jgi:hypothetical protein
MFLWIFFTKTKLMLKQFTSFATTQLESCNMPPSKLTTDFILSAIPDPKNVMLA